MVTIRIGNKKVKVFPMLLLIFILILILYLIINIVFMLPFFKSSARYIEDNNNYKIKNNIVFKRKIFNCYTTEKINVVSSNKIIINSLKKDLLSDGYKLKRNNYVRTLKYNKSCKKVKEEYKKIYDSKYIIFKLNGNNSEKVKYKEKYNDMYVEGKINSKNIKDIDVLSNYNENMLGTYIMSYTMKVNLYYKKRLYRIIKVIDDESPVITLNGDAKIQIDYNTNYIESGFTAVDNYDGNITNNVKIKNTINNKKPGLYKITYTVSDSSGNKTKVIREVLVNEEKKEVINVKPKIEQKDGITYINGILLVNKKYSLPKDYDPNVNNEALKALKQMQSDASLLGLKIPLVSGYRSYETQNKLYNKYVKADGEEKANTYSAKPGHSEHQTGLAFDIGRVEDSFKNTKEAKWIEENAHLYGFIVRYPLGKTNITGYIYEPWHVRYLGIDIATKVKQSNLCLEEYLGVN